MHFVWSEIADERQSYEHHRVEHHLSLGFDAVTGPVTDDNRTDFVESATSKRVEEIIAYWKQLDDRIGLRTAPT